MTLTTRLTRRFEDEICPVCAHRTASAGCSLTARRECPIFEWSEKLAAVVADIDSDRLGDYMDQVGKIICPDCCQGDDGACAAREHLDCPLDLYFGLVVEILEDELP